MAVDERLFLAESATLSIQQGIPVLRHKTSEVSHCLTLGEAIALSFLAASGCKSEASRYCGEYIANGSMWVNRVVERYRSYLGGQTRRQLDFDWLDWVDFDALSVGRAGRRGVAPQALVWLVTLACNRRCPYCYYEVTPHGIGLDKSPADASFSMRGVFRMLAEMQDIGASELYLTGGEPLLRHDLIDILGEADRRRVRAHLSTKYPIDEILASKLADANVASITYSLDAGTGRIADGLAGNKGFFQEAVRALNALKKAGHDPEVNAVLTRASAHCLDDLAALLVDCGIARLSVSLFIQPPRSDFSTKPLVPVQDHTILLSIIEDLSNRWAGQLDIRLGDSGQNLSTALDLTQNVCEVGYSELHVLPDGTATRCRYLPAERALQLGSLDKLTIMDIWTGSSFEALNSPARSNYAGTSCASCNAFERCNERGRCYVSALQAHGELSAPDSFCRTGLRM